MIGTLQSWELRTDVIVALDPAQEYPAILRKYVGRDGTWEYETVAGDVGRSNRFYPVSEDALRVFIMNSAHEAVPAVFTPNNPNADMLALRNTLDLLYRQIEVVKQYRNLVNQRKAEAKRQASQANTQKLEAEAVQLFDQAQVGDLVRIVGMRNARYNYRKIVSKHDASFQGQQYARTRAGTFIPGGEYTQTSATKIRELIPAGQWSE